MKAQRIAQLGVFVVAAMLLLGLFWVVRPLTVTAQADNDAAAVVQLAADDGQLYLPLVMTAQITPTFPLSATAVVDSNVRSCASTLCSVVDGLSVGEVVTVVACNTDCSWYQLDSGDWVFAVLLRLLP